jgi:hypothetical protein
MFQIKTPRLDWELRAHALLKIRQEFAKAGYPLDRFRDSELGAAITHWNKEIAAFTIRLRLFTAYSNGSDDLRMARRSRWGFLKVNRRARLRLSRHAKAS